MTSSKWVNLEKFSVELATGSGRVYANGRQQLKLRITLRALDINGKAVEMTEAELDSLILIDAQFKPIPADPLKYGATDAEADELARQLYDPTEYGRVMADKSVAFDATKHDRLQFNKYREDFNNLNWMWSKTQNGMYRFFSPTSSVRTNSYSSSEPAEHEYSVDVYVRTISKEKITVSAQVTRSDGTKFYSNYPERQDGSQDLVPERPPVYTADKYSFSRIAISGDVESTKDFDSVDYYRFELVSGGDDVLFLNFDMAPVSIRRDAIAPKNRGSITGYTHPGSDEFNYGMSMFSTQGKLRAGYKKPGIVYVCLMRRSNFFAATIPAVTRGPTTIKAQDIYGNDHEVLMQFKGAGRNYLELV